MTNPMFVVKDALAGQRMRVPLTRQGRSAGARIALAMGWVLTLSLLMAPGTSADDCDDDDGKACRGQRACECQPRQVCGQPMQAAPAAAAVITGSSFCPNQYYGFTVTPFGKVHEYQIWWKLNCTGRIDDYFSNREHDLGCSGGSCIDPIPILPTVRVQTGYVSPKTEFQVADPKHVSVEYNGFARLKDAKGKLHIFKLHTIVSTFPDVPRHVAYFGVETETHLDGVPIFEASLTNADQRSRFIHKIDVSMGPERKTVIPFVVTTATDLTAEQ